MAGNPWSKVALGALAVVAAAAVLVVATDEPAPDPARPEPTRSADPDGATELLGDGPAWTQPGSPVATPGSPGVRNGLVLLQREEGRGELVLVDLRTGEPRWSLPFDSALAGSAERFAGGGILIGNGVLVRTRTGVALLSLETASLRWRADVRSGAGERYVLAAANDETVLVTVGPTRGGPPRVLALDAGTGQRRWERAGLMPHGMAGGVVVGETAPGGTVAAWSTASGATAWTLAGFASARVALTADDDVLVEGRTDAGEPVRRVYEANDGEQLVELGDPGVGACATDGVRLIACPRANGPRDRVLQTFDVADRRTRTLSGEFRPEFVCLVGPDHVFAASAEAYFVVARGGALVAPDLPGRPVAATEDHLLLRSDVAGDTADPPLTSAYRLRK
ncbi:MAG: PQQ-binding-like beta-propeller repeat protein [Actinophytocola sp.]|uniref:outer membrane protein assembly factor BamB family protein n=1 Tax=Actinophytocola sp. TaxID=1872138 RepID=UPI003D6C0CD8